MTLSDENANAKLGDNVAVADVGDEDIRTFPGRKKTLMIAGLVSSIAGVVGAFMPEAYSYALTRFLKLSFTFSIDSMCIFIREKWFVPNCNYWRQNPKYGRLFTGFGAQGLMLMAFNMSVEVVRTRHV